MNGVQFSESDSELISIDRIKNPFAIVMGHVLKRIRKGLGMKTADSFAEMLEIKPNYYRTIESGKKTISQNHILAVIQSIRMLDSECKPQFESLAIFVNLVSLIDSTVRSKALQDDLLHLSSYREIIEEIMEAGGPWVQELLVQFLETGVFEVVHQSDRVEALISRHQLEGKLWTFITDFQLMGKSKSEVEDTIFENQIGDIPGLYLDLVVDFLNKLSRLPMEFSGSTAYRWEDENADELKGLIAFLSESSLICSPENLQYFNYLFLFQDRPGSATFVYLDGPKGGETPMELFRKNLKHALKENDRYLDDEAFERGMSKVTFIYCPPDKFDRKVFDLDPKYGLDGVTATWVFTKVNHFNYGFAAKTDGFDYRGGRSLDTSTTREKLNLMERILKMIT